MHFLLTLTKRICSFGKYALILIFFTFFTFSFYNTKRINSFDFSKLTFFTLLWYNFMHFNFSITQKSQTAYFKTDLQVSRMPRINLYLPMDCWQNSNPPSKMLFDRQPAFYSNWQCRSNSI